MTATIRSEQAQDLKVEDFITRGASSPLPRIYGESLVKAAADNSKIVCLCADLSSATETDLFRDIYPERFFHTGIAEANMIGIAGGMARSGDIPFVHSFSVFATRRCYDQIAMQVAYPNLPVKIVGFLPGLTTLLGVSHQAIDDVSLMRSLPNMTIIEPDGSFQTREAVNAALSVKGPVYLRLRRIAAQPTLQDMREFHVGQAELLRDGAHGFIVACGLMVEQALQASSDLSSKGISIGVVNMSTIKPLDRKMIIKLAKQGRIMVTAENHSVVGGLGSAVAEVLAESDVSVRFRRIGVQDTFAEGGTTPYLFEKYGLTARAIADTVESLLIQNY